MTPTIAALMLTAALLHTSWHLMIKSNDDRLTVLVGMNLVASIIALCALPFAAVPFPAPEVWPVLALSVALHAGYNLALPLLYRDADIGQAFPIARGLTPVFATLIAYLALGETVNRVQGAAIAGICAGLVALSLGRDRGGFRISFGFLRVALTIGLLVACYAVVDAHGTRLNGDWLGFTVWVVLLTSAVLLPVATKINGVSMWADLARAKRRSMVSGLLGISAFGVFMWALSLGAVGPVIAVRETSILFSVLLGVVLLREKLSAARIGGALAVLAGVTVLAAGG
jgi:drug/metabolite transporter (DMT)-like permease